MMKMFGAAALAASVLFPHSVSAQTTGKFAVGVTATRVMPADGDLQTAQSIGIVLRQIPKKGIGLAGALNWFQSDLEGDFIGIPGEIGSLRVRPLMAGVSYTIGERFATTFSVVGGPSFNRLRIRDDVPDVDVEGDDNVFERSVSNVSIAVRPGVGVSFAVAPRFAVIGFGGYMFNRPKFTIRTAAGAVENEWSADALVISAGVAVALF
jgi:hypothetical protein